MSFALPVTLGITAPNVHLDFILTLAFVVLVQLLARIASSVPIVRSVISVLLDTTPPLALLASLDITLHRFLLIILA